MKGKLVWLVAVMIILVPFELGVSRSSINKALPTCHVQDEKFPDPQCTPGAILEVTVDDICVKGYTQTVRHVTQKTKQDVFGEYGITSHGKGEYEVDHFIPLELGGSNDISNLWPEAAEPKPGFHEKDRVENYLHMQVCLCHMSLEEAQKEIQGNWLEVYNKINQ